MFLSSLNKNEDLHETDERSIKAPRKKCWCWIGDVRDTKKIYMDFGPIPGDPQEDHCKANCERKCHRKYDPSIHLIHLIHLFDLIHPLFTHRFFVLSIHPSICPSVRPLE